MRITGNPASGGKKPGTPTIGTATKGNASATVAFTAPTYVGKGGTVTYRATSSPGSLTGTSTTSPITVSGLTNGTAYTFTVVAETSYGVNGDSSAASNSVTPAAPPTVTGGTLTSDATYYYRTFTSNGTLSISGGNVTMDVLIVGSGGQGGPATRSGPAASRTFRYGGGGGGSGVKYNASQSLTGDKTIVIAAGTGTPTASTFTDFTGAGRGGTGGSGNGNDAGSGDSTLGGGGGGGGSYVINSDPIQTGSYSGGTGYGGASNGASPGAGGGQGPTFTQTGATYFGTEYGRGGDASGSGGSAGPANTGWGGDGANEPTSNTTVSGFIGGSGVVVVRYTKSQVD